MEYNKIYRRQSTLNEESYQDISSDLKELFQGYSGVSIEQHFAVPGGTSEEYLKIYIDKNNRLYLLVEPDENYGARISFHCGDGVDENEDWVYIDNRVEGKRFVYNFVKTPYGAAFSTLPFSSGYKTTLSDGFFQNYFSTFETVDGETVNGFVFCSSPMDEQSNYSSYFATEVHDKLESVNFDNCFYGRGANHTVLLNMTSYSKRIVSRHLFKKIQSEEGKFGKIKINGRTFISGSHLCLDAEEE